MAALIDFQVQPFDAFLFLHQSLDDVGFQITGEEETRISEIHADDQTVVVLVVKLLVAPSGTLMS